MSIPSFLSQISGEAELSQPAWRCTEHLLCEASGPVSWGAGGAKWCICWCQVWASQPRKESPKLASPPPFPPAPVPVNGHDLEGGHADQKLSSRVHRLHCLLRWLQGKAVALLSPPRCSATSPGCAVALGARTQGSEAGIQARGCPSRGLTRPPCSAPSVPGSSGQLCRPVPWQGAEVLMLSLTTAFVCKHPQETVPRFLGMLVGVGTCF